MKNIAIALCGSRDTCETAVGELLAKEPDADCVSFRSELRQYAGFIGMDPRDCFFGYPDFSVEP